MRIDRRCLLPSLSLSLLALASPVKAQDSAPIDPAQRVGRETSERISQGRAQYENNDARAVATLRDAAQSALMALGQVSKVNLLATPTPNLPGDAVTSALAQKAAEAHFYWGLAADRFARRDEAITALSRALRINAAMPILDGTNLRRDAKLELGRILRDGLPVVAPDDALDSIASVAHVKQWKPSRSTFDTSPTALSIGGAPSKFEFLVTDGKLFPPVGPNNVLYRVPGYYKNVPEVSLPAVLQLDKMVAGYVREISGSNKGQWRQVVRVFYASPFRTKGKRDDLPRARALCEQFLKVQSLMRDQLGVTNLFSRGERDEGISTLWLLEISALWPQDDEDPNVLAQLGPLMPKPNAGPKQAVTEPDITATDRPWMPIAGQVESSPGEIIFWKAGMARPEAEWARELFHEYGHVSLPPLGGFRPPLEPYGNGLIGETLGMIWATQTPDRFGAKASDFATHVNTQAFPALRFFLKAGPASPLRSAGTYEGLRYLQGLSTYLERVYGGQMLGKALQPLAKNASSIDNIAARRSAMNTQSLLSSIDRTWSNAWGTSKTIPIWLPGAMQMNSSGANLVSRAEAVLKARTTVPVVLYVPPGTNSLRVDGLGASNLRAVGLPFKASSGGVNLYFAGKTGWQSFSLTTTGDAKITSARFEKK